MSIYLRYMLGLVLGATLGTGALFALVNVDPIHFFNVEYPMWTHQRLAASSADDADVLILGDSRMMGAFDPLQADGLDYRLLTVGGASSIEEYFQFRNYLEINRAPSAVVISFAPYHLAEAYAFWSRAVRYSFVSIEEYRDVIGVAREVGGQGFAAQSRIEEEWQTSRRYWHSNSRYRLPHRYSPELFASMLLRKSKNEEVYDFVETHKGHFLFGRAEASSKRAHEADLDEFEAAPIIDTYLERILALAAESRIPVYWFTMPFNRATYEELDPNYVEGYAAYLRDKQARFSGFHVMNSVGFLEDSFFGDEHHVNFRGVERVTAELHEVVTAQLLEIRQRDFETNSLVAE